MLHRRVECFHGLSQQRHPTSEYCTGDHHRHFAFPLRENVADRKQTRLHIQRVKTGLRQQQIDTAIQQTSNLFSIGFHHLVKRKRPRTGLISVHRQLNFRGPNAARHEARLTGIGCGRFVSHSPSELCTDAVDLPGQMRKFELFQRHDVGVERIGLDDVGADVDVFLMYFGNQIRLRQHQQVSGILDIDVMISESITTIERFVGFLRHDQRAH